MAPRCTHMRRFTLPVQFCIFITKNGRILGYNYNCHNIYWDPLIWLVKNGHLIALTCISFFNEPGPYSWGAGPFTTELLLWYCAMLLWREMDSLQLLTLYLTLTHIFSGRKAKINLHTTPKLTVVMPISCLLSCMDPGITSNFSMKTSGFHAN